MVRVARRVASCGASCLPVARRPGAPARILAALLLFGETSTALRAAVPAARPSVGGTGLAAALSMPSPRPSAETRKQARSALAKLPLHFVKNEGQADPRAAYYVQGTTTSVYLTPQSVLFTLSKPAARPVETGLGASAVSTASFASERWTLRLVFEGANPRPTITGQDPTPTAVSYFTGPRSRWKTQLATYASVVYEELWPGIDLVYSGDAGRLKYTFLVKPGADPARIRLRYEGATAIGPSGGGRLKVETPIGGFEEEAPYAYQQDGDDRADVAAAFAPAGDRQDASYRFGFEVGAYDRTRLLVLDPIVLAYCGYIGGSAVDDAYGLAVDTAGNAYVAGRTQSTAATFPDAVGPDVSQNGGDDAFIAKVNAAGTALVYCGYIGGSGFDIAYEVAVDAAGNAYVTGSTTSTALTFPETVGPDLTYNAGPVDAFVAKVNAAGNALVYCGYIGGNGTDEGFAIAVDGSGNAYVAGRSDSAAGFPVAGPGDLTPNGGDDAFVAKVNAAGTAIVYCVYLGGSGGEQVNGIVVDAAGNAYIGGRTGSTEATFPVAVGPDLTYNGGSLDGFVAELSTTGATVYCGYVGGSGDEEVTAVAVNGAGNLFFSGTTGSTEASFPVTVGPDLTFNGATFDAFVAKLNAAGTAYVYCGYIGGTGDDNARDMDIDASGRVLVTGHTNSTETSFPVWQGPDLTYNGGGHDVWVAMVNPGGTALIFCTFLGGSGDDTVQALAVDGSGNVYVAGATDSTEATFPVTAGPDLTSNGGGDAWIAKISLVATAVTLQSLTAKGVGGGVELAWSTASELQNLGFNLYRAESAAGPYARLTPTLIPGLGSSPTGASYSYTDAGLSPGTRYFYRLEDVETTGRMSTHGPVEATALANGAGADSGGSGAGSGLDTGSGSADDPAGDASGSTRVTYGDPTDTGVRILERDATHVVLELVTGGFRAIRGRDGTTRIAIPGFAVSASPGAPAIPTRSALVEAVAGRRVRLASVRAEDLVTFTGMDMAATAAPEMIVTESGSVRPGSAWRRPRAVDRLPGLVPRAWARVRGTLFQGDVKKARLELAPVRHDPVGGRTVLARRLVVRLDFAGVEPGERPLRAGRGRRPPKPTEPSPRGVIAQLAVAQRGLQRARFDELFRSSRRPVPVASLRLSRQGRPVAFHVEPPGATFSPGGQIFFWSDGDSLNPWGDAVYELQVGAAGLTMLVVDGRGTSPEVSTYLETRRFEQNRYYQAGLLEAPDLWQWDLVVSPLAKSYPFTLDGLAPGGGPGRVRVVLQGASDFEELDHHVRISLNGAFVGEATWDGKTEHVVDVEVPAALFAEGANTLRIENVGDAGALYSMVFLDRFEVTYARRTEAVHGALSGRFASDGEALVTGLTGPAFVLDTTLATPAWLRGPRALANELSFRAEAGHSYAVVGDTALRAPAVRPFAAGPLRSRARGAAWLLLAPRELLAAAEPLVELRRAQGLEAAAVAVEDVFAEFGCGERNPDAIRAFLAYAYHEWRRGPRYVVLLGDGSYDPKNYLGTGKKDLVPSPLVKTTYLWTASDPTLAAVNGDDAAPDLAIGRLSAANADEAERLVRKLVAYEAAGRGLGGRAVLVADNDDEGGSFESDADALAADVLRDREVHKLYVRTLGPGATRAEIKAAFDQGAGLLSYVGHGGTAVWASENVFNNTDVPALQPQAEQPLLLTFDCLNGFFQFPALDSLAEALVKAEGKGAIAAFSPSGLSVDAPAHAYERALLREIESGRHARLGDAILAAQSAYADSGALPELLSIYHLFGDPAMELARSAP
jgi:hypothetical protein